MAETFLNIINTDTTKKWKSNLEPKKKLKISIPRGYGSKQIEERWNMLLNRNEKWKETVEREGEFIQFDPKEEILDPKTLERHAMFNDNIENFIGTVKVPVGIAGPVRVNGLHAQGDYFVPLATTEAALVASMNRGISAINASGGATAAVISEGVNRDPVFIFSNLIEAGQFLAWATKNFQNFKIEAEKTTRYGKLVDIKYTLEANNVHMKCIFTTGDAMGQNMVTIATEKIVEYIKANCPIKHYSFLDGGMSGDKKANSANMLGVRGKKVVVEVTIPKDVLWKVLHVTPENAQRCSLVGTRGLQLIGAAGYNCHFANPMAAMAIALGQDPACVAEMHIGLARSEITKDGDLYVCATFPNILVGTVGGGTKLPSQSSLLRLMGLYGKGKANALAEVMATVCVAGELSLGSAIVSGDFAKAHKILARDNNDPIDLTKDTLVEAFEKAQALLVKLSNIPPKNVIMDIYGLYKQATIGDINIAKPSMFSTDLKGKAKYEAWKKMKGMSQDEAMRKYIDLILKLSSEESKKK